MSKVVGLIPLTARNVAGFAGTIHEMPVGGFLGPAKRGGTRHMAESYRSIITIEPGKRGGRPCIRGMRITVYDILSYLAAGINWQEILDDFPYLTEVDIRACLSCAADRERHTLVATR